MLHRELLGAARHLLSGRPPESGTSSPTARPAHRASRWWRLHEERLLPPLSFLAVAVLWQVLSGTGVIDTQFFSSPIGIVVAGVREVQTGFFWGDVWTTVSEFVVGYSTAVVVGISVGMVWGFYRRLGYTFKPWLDALNGIPALALIPLVLIWVGIGFTADVVIVFVATIVPVVVNMYTATRSVDQHFVVVAASFGASRRHLLRTVLVPSMTPFAFAAARIAVGRAVSGVVVAEFFAAQSGLAFQMFQYAEALQTADLLFGAITITFLALGAFMVVRSAERRLLRWRMVGSGTQGTA